MEKTRIFDASSLVGIIGAFIFIVLAIYLGGNSLAFLDLRSALIVLGGTFALTTACFTFAEVMSTQATLLRTIFYSAEDARKSALTALELAEVARKKGLLGLQKYDHLMRENSFFRRGMNFVIDGIPYEEAERILRQELAGMLDRHKKGASVLRKAAEISPAVGLIGTLIGLIQMLGNLQDPSSIGPAMAVALLTTFYGAALSYMVFSPLASKLERNSKEERIVMDIYLATVSSIGRKENPRRLEMLINAILPPDQRVKYFS